MDLQKLRYFSVLADELHFGRAAARLFLSQSALSTAIRSLERSLGVVLFERTSRRVALTEAGRALLPQTERLLAEADHLLANAREHRSGGAGRLRLAFVGQAANELTPRLVELFAAQHRGVHVELRQVAAHQVTGLLRTGEADVAILRLPVSSTAGLVVSRLFEEDRVAVLPADHVLARRGVVTLAELLDEPWVLGATDDDAQRRFATAADRRDGAAVRPGPTVETLDEYLEAVAAHQGIGLAPVSVTRFYARPGIAFVPVQDAEPSVVALSWAASAPEAARWGRSLRDLAHDVWQREPPPGSRTLAADVPGQRGEARAARASRSAGVKPA